MASVVVGFGQNIPEKITPLIYFMVFFPVLVFFGFLWLVANHHGKLYGPSDFKDENNFIKTQMASAASIAAAIAKQSGNDSELTEEKIKDIIDIVLNKTIDKAIDKSEKWKKSILWVDDNPENNFYERQSFEAQGIEFTTALSTNEAINLMLSNQYAAIISDMGRREGDSEGYVLLQKNTFYE